MANKVRAEKLTSLQREIHNLRAVHSETRGEYVITDVVPLKVDGGGGWMLAVIYRPLYKCEIPCFCRSLDNFLESFEIGKRPFLEYIKTVAAECLFPIPSVGGRYMIRKGACVGQDFGFFPCEGETAETIFKLETVSRDGRCKLTAPGYGNRDDYGNGSVFVKDEDLVRTADGLNQDEKDGSAASGER